jgi:hypothetical protein
MSGIQANSSNVQVATGSKRYTGLANMTVISISPSMEEIKARGGRADKEPEYTTNEFVEAKNYPSGEAVPEYNYLKTRLDFNVFIAALKYYNKLAIWVGDRPRWNREHNKVEWINKFGQNAWTTAEQIEAGTQLTEPPSGSKYTWFKSEGARPALEGEVQLAQFLQAWANVPTDQQCTLDHPTALAKGDFSEIRGLLGKIPNNEVKLLNGVKKVEKDGKINYYAAIYSGHFARANDNSFNKWKEALGGQYGKFDADYQGDLTFKEWNEDPRVVGDSPTNLELPAGASAPGAAPAFNF